MYTVRWRSLFKNTARPQAQPFDLGCRWSRDQVYLPSRRYLHLLFGLEMYQNPRIATRMAKNCRGIRAGYRIYRMLICRRWIPNSFERPHEYEGWYCRKSFPAINALVVLDHRTRILSYNLRHGSANDMAIRNYSKFGTIFGSMLPKHPHSLGDAGFKLSETLLITYPIKDNVLV